MSMPEGWGPSPLQDVYRRHWLEAASQRLLEAWVAPAVKAYGVISAAELDRAEEARKKGLVQGGG